VYLTANAFFLFYKTGLASHSLGPLYQETAQWANRPGEGVHTPPRDARPSNFPKRFPPELNPSRKVSGRVGVLLEHCPLDI